MPIGTALEMYAYPGAQELTVLEAGVYQGSTDNGQMLRVKVRIRAIQATEYSAYQFKVVGAEDTPQYEMPYWHREMAAGAISVEEFLFDIRGEDSSQLFLRWNPAAGDPRYFALQ
ncbi:MAG: hypothetical protein JW753_07410 [Dehalococcoidia bacterium]|nr:hypothetical protein [Dehalococcoidia bacterium]